MPAKHDFYPKEHNSEFADVTGSSPDTSGEGHTDLGLPCFKNRQSQTMTLFHLLPRRENPYVTRSAEFYVESFPEGLSYY